MQMGRKNTVGQWSVIRCIRIDRSIHGCRNAVVPVNAVRVFSFILIPVPKAARLIAAATVFALACVVLPVRAGEDLDDKVVALLPDNPMIVERGREVYESHCASCHGKQLEGQDNWRQRFDNGMLPAPPHDKTGHTWHHADDLLFEITKYGVAKVIGDPDYLNMMPVFESALEDKDIIAVLSFIKSTWPAEVRERQERINNAQENGFEEVKNKSWLDRWLNR